MKNIRRSSKIPPVYVSLTTIFLAGVLALPIFLRLSDSGLQLARSDRGSNLNTSTGIPLSTLFLGLFGLAGIGMYFFKKKARLLSIDSLVFCYAIWPTLAFFWRINQDGEFSSHSFRMFIQVLLPLTAFAFIRGFYAPEQTKDQAALFLKTYASVISIWLLAHIVQTCISGGTNTWLCSLSDHVGPFENIKALRQFPIAMTISLIITVTWLIHLVKKSTNLVIHKNSALDLYPIILALFLCTLLSTSLTLYHARYPLAIAGLFGIFTLTTYSITYKKHLKVLKYLCSVICFFIIAIFCMGITNPELLRDRSLNRTTFALFGLKIVPGQPPLAQFITSHNVDQARGILQTNPNHQSTGSSNTPDNTPRTSTSKPHHDSTSLNPDSNSDVDTNSNTPANTYNESETETKLNRFDQIRLKRLKEGFRLTMSHPFGTAYHTAEYKPAIYEPFKPQGLDRANYTGAPIRIYPSESGYLDIGVRAGYPNVLLLITILVGCIFHCVGLKKSQEDNWVATALTSIMIFGIGLGSIWLNLLTEPFVAPVLWATMAWALSLPKPQKT